MYIPSFKQVREVTDSHYKLTLMVAERARQINDGDEPTIDTNDKNTVTIALKEIIDGDIIEDVKAREI